MKKITTLTFITLISLALNAQSLLPIKYGIKAGANVANIKSNAREGIANIDNSTLIGLSGGFYMEIPLTDKWYLNPELVYSQKGSSFEYDYTQDYNTNNRQEYSTNNNLSLTYLKLNPTFSYKINYKISLNAGPSFGFLISKAYEYTQDPTNQHSLTDGEFKEETIDVGLNYGWSYYISEDFLISLMGYTGLLKTGEINSPIDIKEEKTSYTIKNDAFVFSLAYLF